MIQLNISLSKHACTMYSTQHVFHFTHTGLTEGLKAGQAKLNLRTIQLNVWVTDTFTTADILFLLVIV